MAERNRILILVHSYFVRDTRPRRHAASLADAGWDVDVICAREPGEKRKERVGHANVWRLPARRRRGGKLRYIFEYISFAMLAAVAVPWAHVRRRYRTVYVIGVPNFLAFAAMVPRLKGARVLLDMRDPLPEFFRAKYGFGERHPVVRALLVEERLSARFASGVVTVHDSMARLYERSLPPERISVVMNAPDPRLFDRPPAGVARDPDDRTMLYAGTVAARYGVDLTVRALGRLREEIPALRLRIVGDGDLLPELRRIARAEGVEDRVEFDRPVPLDRIPDVVAASWIGVQPNRDDPLMRFSLSAKVLEWCRLGLPVIAGETAPLTDAFAPDEVAFHPPGDLEGLCARIREAHADPAGLAARAQRARAAAERFSHAREVARLLDIVGPRG